MTGQQPGLPIDWASGWIDVTQPVQPGMAHWPGDPSVEIDLVSDMSRGESCNVSRLVMGAHTGTHIDAPVHYLPGEAGAEAAPLSALMGRARVLQPDDRLSVRRAWLESQDVQQGERIFFKTRQSDDLAGQPFREDYVYLAADAAGYLAERGVLLVGIDTMSVGGFYHEMVETHRALLQGGCWIVENVDLSQIEPGDWDVICLPMKLVGCDGAPARVLMKRRPGHHAAGDASTAIPA